MASVVKRLRPRIVVPICMGSNPIRRPIYRELPLREFFYAHDEGENPFKGSSASKLRAQVLSLQQVKLVKRKTADPLNAGEQDNSMRRPIKNDWLGFIVTTYFQYNSTNQFCANIYPKNSFKKFWRLLGELFLISSENLFNCFWLINK